MLQKIRSLFCRHLWLHVLTLGGFVATKRGTYDIPGNIYIDYCPKCHSIRGRHHDR